MQNATVLKGDTSFDIRGFERGPGYWEVDVTEVRHFNNSHRQVVYHQYRTTAMLGHRGWFSYHENLFQAKAAIHSLDEFVGMIRGLLER